MITLYSTLHFFLQLKDQGSRFIIYCAIEVNGVRTVNVIGLIQLVFCFVKNPNFASQP